MCLLGYKANYKKSEHNTRLDPTWDKPGTFSAMPVAHAGQPERYVKEKTTA